MGLLSNIGKAVKKGVTFVGSKVLPSVDPTNKGSVMNKLLPAVAGNVGMLVGGNVGKNLLGGGVSGLLDIGSDIGKSFRAAPSMVQPKAIGTNVMNDAATQAANIIVTGSNALPVEVKGINSVAPSQTTSLTLGSKLGFDFGEILKSAGLGALKSVDSQLDKNSPDYAEGKANLIKESIVTKIVGWFMQPMAWVAIVVIGTAVYLLSGKKRKWRR